MVVFLRTFSVPLTCRKLVSTPAEEKITVFLVWIDRMPSKRRVLIPSTGGEARRIQLTFRSLRLLNQDFRKLHSSAFSIFPFLWVHATIWGARKDLLKPI